MITSKCCKNNISALELHAITPLAVIGGRVLETSAAQQSPSIIKGR